MLNFRDDSTETDRNLRRIAEQAADATESSNDSAQTGTSTTSIIKF